MNNDRKFISCDCGSEAIVIDKAPDWGEVFFGIFQYANDKVWWRRRLRYIWRIIRYGTPYGDQICLDRASVLEMIEFLEEWIDE